MKKITIDSLHFSDSIRKFGYSYKEAIFDDGKYFASFPYFDGIDKLNGIILEIAGAHYAQGRRLLVKLAYADSEHVSLTLGDRFAISFSTSLNTLLPPRLILSLTGLSKRDLKKHLPKGYRAQIDTLRFTGGGVKLAICSRDDVKILRIVKKIKQKT